jgi:hypothetical protein
MRILKNISKSEFGELIEKYVQWADSPFPHELIDIYEIREKFWMDKELSAEEFELTYKTKLKLIGQTLEGENWNIPTEPLEGTNMSGADIVLKEMNWFHQLDNVPDSVKNLFKDGKLELGEWYKLKKEDLKEVKLPKVIKDHYSENGGAFGLTYLTWRELFMDPAFATLIARLFQNSFRNGRVKQDFRLTPDRTSDNLVRIVDRYIGRRRFNELLKEGTLNIFNSSSLCANLLVKLMNSWLPFVVSKQAQKIPLHIRVYKNIKKRIINRRTKSDDPTEFYLFKRIDYQKTMIGLKKPGGPDFPLTPYECFKLDRHYVTNEHLKRKYKDVQSFTIKTITRSAVSVHEMYTSSVYLPNIGNVYPYKKVYWDTLSPKVKKLPKFRFKSMEPKKIVKSKLKWEKLSSKYSKQELEVFKDQ